MYTLANTLRLWRQAQNLTQFSLACRLGCSAATISAYECAQRKMYLPYLQRIATYLRQPLEALLPQLLQYCPPSERLLLRGELDYQRQLEQVQANKARQCAQDYDYLLSRCHRKLQQLSSQQRELLAECQGTLPAAFHLTDNPFTGTSSDLLRLRWDKCYLAMRLLYLHRKTLQQQHTRAQLRHRKHTQGALRWQQAFRQVLQWREVA